MRRAIHLACGWANLSEDVTLTLITGNTRKRIRLTTDEAQTLSNRLQSYAKGNQGSELVIDKEQA